MGPFLPLLAKDSSAMTNCTLDNNVFDNDTSGRHFLFDERWRNGVYIPSAFGASSNRIISTSQQDDVLIKQNSSMLLPYPEFHVYRSHNFTRFAHRKEFSLGNPKPLVFGADYLTSFPSVLLPATTPSVGEGLCLSQNYKNRSRVKNKARNRVDAKNKFHSYPDPLLGATSNFVQRMTEISSLEAETVRQEKIRKLKKINRQDS
ncbi:uncharacterized protein si:ch211-171b20.3 [Triplophysa rosa]|uniref:uncharacterized protein si:ch211-171b20.3 n=1 Tax=Triplophysa rosa TaxID=992332 RepID=UPI002545E95A|nr:uncharacterized protein si:ch211-171b20.3 [Triplophysa rosa]